MQPKIEICGLSKAYQALHHGSVQALENLDLSVPEGAFLSLIGPSGCGKSTLIRILANLCDATIGRVTIRIDATQTRPLHAVVFQEYALFPWRTALENVAFGLEMRGIPKRERQEIAQTYLVRMGLARFAHHYPHQLSGGMQQRIAIARAFANNPEILLMDEPFGALDAQTRMRMQTELLQMWEEEHKTVLYITHSIEEALILGDRVALMTARPGKIHRIYPVALPRPRTLEMQRTPEFNRLAGQIWDDLCTQVRWNDDEQG